MIVKDCLKEFSYSVIKGDLSCEVTGFAVDNRKVKPGDIFICIKGVNFDTHNAIKEIASNGPSALVVSESEIVYGKDGKSRIAGIDLSELDCAIVSTKDTRYAKACVAAHYYGNPSKKLTCVGVTGSKGKTTTAHMLFAIFRRSGRNTGIIGTNGVQYIDKDGKNVEIELANTTPDSEDMQGYLSDMVEAGVDTVVIECSSQGLMLHRTAPIVFDYGIFTNIERGDHVGPNEHKSFEEYLFCKGLLLKSSKVAVVNSDDEHVDALMEDIETPAVFYGTEDQGNRELSYILSDIRLEKENGEPGVKFNISGKIDSDFFTDLPGEFNAHNAAAAIAVASEMGISTGDMKAALSDLHIKGRFDMIYRTPELTVCVDFAHNGFSTENHLKALREYEPKRIVCVFGADGDRARSRRTGMGEAAGRYADFSIVTSGHNRSESFYDILPAIEEGLSKTTGEYIAIEDRKEAIRYAIDHREPGDLITIIGLGHESYQEYDGVKHPYSDRDFAKEVLKEKGIDR